ncbi:MAG: hypothetical protein RIS73_1717 [Bacteroidota bacterium]|jgi:hypothetical protein
MLIKDSLLLAKKKQPMIKTVFVFVISFLALTIVNAQYYYKDILSTKQVIAEMAQLKEQKIKTVSLKSFEDDGSPSEGFFCEKRLSKNYSTAEMLTKSFVTGASVFTSSFTNKGLLIQTIDSSEISSSTSVYSYADNDKIKSIVSIVRSSDDDFKNEIREEHLYEYDEKGLPIKMIRIKNSGDSTIFLFSTDEKNNISIEKNTKTGDTYYYYYDTKNRITDVVRLNQFNQKMLPDYIFEYTNTGLVAQMTTTEEGGSYYFIWKYTYDNGLRIKEKCFSKEKRLMGTIEYEYK